jgi:hypothetical protein
MKVAKPVQNDKTLQTYLIEEEGIIKVLYKNRSKKKLNPTTNKH